MEEFKDDPPEYIDFNVKKNTVLFPLLDGLKNKMAKNEGESIKYEITFEYKNNDLTIALDEKSYRNSDNKSVRNFKVNFDDVMTGGKRTKKTKKNKNRKYLYKPKHNISQRIK